jgi:hypothetical protein
MKAFSLILTLVVFTMAAVAQETGKPKLGDTPAKRTGKTFVQVYFEENFKGRSVRLEVPCEIINDAGLKELGIKNDSIMSMKIPDGVTVTLFNAANYGPPSQSFTGKAATLGILKGSTSSIKAVVKDETKAGSRTETK